MRWGAGRRCGGGSYISGVQGPTCTNVALVGGEKSMEARHKPEATGEVGSRQEVQRGKPDLRGGEGCIELGSGGGAGGGFE